jgi:hypothetical protein
MMKKISLVALAMLIPIAISSADAYTLKQPYKALKQQKVCLTNIGWCSDYSKRSAESTSCYCRNHQQNPGRVTNFSVTLSTVPQID